MLGSRERLGLDVGLSLWTSGKLERWCCYSAKRSPGLHWNTIHVFAEVPVSFVGVHECLAVVL